MLLERTNADTWTQTHTLWLPNHAFLKKQNSVQPLSNLSAVKECRNQLHQRLVYPEVPSDPIFHHTWVSTASKSLQASLLAVDRPSPASCQACTTNRWEMKDFTQWDDGQSGDILMFFKCFFFFFKTGKSCENNASISRHVLCTCPYISICWVSSGDKEPKIINCRIWKAIYLTRWGPHFTPCTQIWDSSSAEDTPHMKQWHGKGRPQVSIYRSNTAFS